MLVMMTGGDYDDYDGGDDYGAGDYGDGDNYDGADDNYDGDYDGGDDAGGDYDGGDDNFSYLGADWSALLWNKLCRHIDGNGNVPGEASSASGVW